MPEILSTVAEVSVTFVGFSALIGLFRGSQGLRGEFRTMFLIEAGLGSLVFSLLPHVFASFEIAMPQIWRFSSLLLGAFVVLEMIHVLVEDRRLYRRGSLSQARWALWVCGGGLVVVAIAQLLNAIGWPWPPSFAVYFLGIFWLLVCAALIFVVSFWVGRYRDTERDAA